MLLFGVRNRFTFLCQYYILSLTKNPLIGLLRTHCGGYWDILGPHQSPFQYNRVGFFLCSLASMLFILFFFTSLNTFSVSHGVIQLQFNNSSSDWYSTRQYVKQGHILSFSFLNICLKSSMEEIQKDLVIFLIGTA